MPFHFSPKFAIPSAALRQAYDGLPVVPDNALDLPVIGNNPTVGLYVTGAGNVAFQHRGGIVGSLTAVPAGTFLDIAVSRVLATGTTATGIFQLADTQV